MQPVAVNHPAVTVTPPIAFLLCLTLGVATNLVMPLISLPNYAQYFIGPLLLIDGIVALGFAARQLRKSGNEISVHRPVSALVTSGIYRYSRNPIYLGMFLGYTGIALLSNNVWLLILEIPLYLYITYNVVVREEDYLQKTFSQKYEVYRSKTRRWI